MKLPRRRFLHLAAATAGLPTITRLAKAQAYPTRPVRIIMGFAPGASGDIAARVLAQALGRLLGQQFIVENRTGAGSNIATNFVAHAPNDGYTLLQGTVANTINPVITANLSFDFPKDFAPISLFATLPNIVVVNPSLGVHSIQELIKLAREKPGELSFGSAGVDQARARAVYRNRASRHRPSRRPPAADVLAGIDRVAIHCRGEARRAGLDRPAPRQRRAGPGDRLRIGTAWIRYFGLVRAPRARRHASRYHRAPRRRLQ
jgi:hypothetical protein